jgi:Reverse transcriptase (RNA-dependent DNA polymerase).
LSLGGRIINKVTFADDKAIIAKTQEELQDMVNRLVDTRRKYGMEINIQKSEIMRIYSTGVMNHCKLK